MLEHFNDYISIVILILILMVFIYISGRSILKTIERNRIKKEMEYIQKRKEEQ